MSLFPNLLLISMLICYSQPIFVVYRNYENGFSISDIINDKETKINIFISFFVMSCFTIIYEVNRNDFLSLTFILILLFGLFGVCLIKEDKTNILCCHNFFAVCIFLSIYSFILYYAVLKSHFFLYILFAIQNIISVIIFKKIKYKEPIIGCEIFLLINFSILYLYLHFTEFI